ncbi:SGNH/GDSL hydrolase family protein [Robiginitalea aurantiaca]|uniref:SGNH/GDSL hydrolase family protein n=1 Tax=Robiginitalea aurantiaca TaxID=3056915 RepID=A0ABT7WCZ6_9FLAO|nr:SGNH/GDSL hydrolase family protein [Robiginitalea aurantiaca]MDM9630785.1 SGNH/GDSL hydrolase family protein [Robiginitalea aurantiaca]
MNRNRFLYPMSCSCKKLQCPANTFFYVLLLGLVFGFTVNIYPQDPLRFESEIIDLKAKTDSLWDREEEVLLFTGSSSIRMWEDLQERFSSQKILNLGFGGSQASDLLYYLEPLVLDYRPKKVFIYEGDNDLAEGKKIREVILTLQEITKRLDQALPGIPIVIISAKPSISRWNLRRKYRKLNRKLERWTSRQETLDFVDVWNPMLTDKTLNDSLFIDDGLHMNESGYDIWEKALAPFITTD